MMNSESKSTSRSVRAESISSKSNLARESSIHMLAFIMLFSMFNQWTRWLPVYLSAVTFDDCDSVCSAVSFTPLCDECVSLSDDSIDDDYMNCDLCHQCRSFHDSQYYNMMDGTCMTTADYGIIAGLGFSLTFGLFGILAGIFVDMKADRGCTILGISSVIFGLATLLLAYCTSFSQVLALRAVVGAAQAFSAPASVNMITKYFTHTEDRPMANSSYTIGVYLGAGLSSLSEIFSSVFGWQLTCKIVGYTCFATAITFEILVDLQPFSSSSSMDPTLHASIAERRPLLHKHRRDSMSSTDNDSNAIIKPQSVLLPQNNSDNANMSPEDALGSAIHNNNSNEIAYTTLTEITIGDYFMTTDDESITNNSNKSHKHHRNSNMMDNNNDAMRFHSKIRLDASMDSSTEMSDDNYHNKTQQNNNNNNNMNNINNNSYQKNEFFIKFKEMFSKKSTDESIYAIPLLLAGSCFRFMGSIAVFVYIPVLVSRRYPNMETVFSIFNAVVVLSCGSFSAFMGGKIGHNLVSTQGLPGLTKVVWVSCFACAVPFVASILIDNFWVSMILLALGYLLGEAWMGASMALLQSLTPGHNQGFAMAVYLFLNWNASALITDVLGWLDPGTDEIAYYLTVATVTTIAISAVLFYCLGRLLKNGHVLFNSRNGHNNSNNNSNNISTNSISNNIIGNNNNNNNASHNSRRPSTSSMSSSFEQ